MLSNPLSLASTPAVLDLAQVVLPQTFAGHLEAYRHFRPHHRLWRLLHHKRWYYVCAATNDAVIGASIIDLGYAGKAFFFLAERGQAKIFARSVLLPKGPWLGVGRDQHGGGRAYVRSPQLWLDLVKRPNGGLSLSGRAGRRHIHLILGDAAETPSVVAATFLTGGATNLTEKTFCRPTRGSVDGRGQTLSLDGGYGGIDFTDGYLPRATKWRWAFFSGRGIGGETVGLNLVQGFNGAPECVVWLNGRLHAVGEGRIQFTAPLSNWRVESSDGAVDLTFTAQTLHAENSNIGIAHGRYVQPIGRFNGHIQVADQTIVIADIPGVVEDQDVLW